MKKIITIILLLSLFIPNVCYADYDSVLDDIEDVYSDLDNIDWSEMSMVATSDYSNYEFVGLYDSENGSLVMLPNMGASKYYNASDWVNAKAIGYNEAALYYFNEIASILEDLEEAIQDLSEIPNYEDGYTAGYDTGYDLGYTVGLGEGATSEDFECQLIEL